MSWDIFVQNFPASAKGVADIPDDFQPGFIGRRNEIIRTIYEIAPHANFADPSWGVIDGPDFSIEVNIGPDDPVRSFAFHVRGSEAAAGLIDAILESLNLRALDSQTGEFFVPGEAAVESFRKWKTYRDENVGG